VRIVDHHQGIVALGEIADSGEVGDDAVHRKDAVRGDQAEAAVLRFPQARLQLGHVVVGIAQPARLAEANAVDDRGVVQRIADHGILFAEDGLEQARIGVEAGAVEDRVLGAEKAGQPLLELLVVILGPADETHRGHAEAVAVERRLGGLDHARMVGKAEIVVCAEIEHRLRPALDLDLRGLRRGQHPLVLIEPALFQTSDLPCEMIGKTSRAHRRGL
jgi:hypothetical protein